jgi:hypothetical protein
MRFDGFVHNRGPGPLEIRATNRSGATMTSVRQRIYDSGGGVFEDRAGSPAPQVLFETDDSHDHWHLKHIARYSLWNYEGTAEAAPAQKAGSAWSTLSDVSSTGPPPRSTASAETASASRGIPRSPA